MVRSRPARALLASALILAAGALGGCGGATGTAASSATATSPAPAPATAAATAASAEQSSAAASSPTGTSMPATTTTIMIQDYAYLTPASVAPGASLSVMNMDQVAHTVTADTGDAFDVQVPAGRTVTFTAPAAAGRYDFHCTYHGNMNGVLVVG